jgi:hypothetical protein
MQSAVESLPGDQGKGRRVSQHGPVIKSLNLPG